MLYNNNIVLNILSTIFEKEIEDYVQDCVIEMDSQELEEYFEREVEYAILSFLRQIIVEDYKIEVRENQEIISGTLEVIGEMEGFCFWDEEVPGERATLFLEVLYEFYAENGKYKDLYLEQLY